MKLENVAMMSPRLTRVMAASILFYSCFFCKGSVNAESPPATSKNSSGESIKVALTQGQQAAMAGRLSTVRIKNYTTNMINPMERVIPGLPPSIGINSSGTGIVFEITDKEIFIVTNKHVVDSKNPVVYKQALYVDLLTQDGRTISVQAEPMFLHSFVDMAVLRVPLEPLGDYAQHLLIQPILRLNAQTVGDAETAHSISQVLSQPGRRVIVVGNPAGEENWITSGVISSNNTTASSVAIGMDASINPGNSGGPVIDEETGALLGMSTFVLLERENMGYIVPARMMELIYSVFRAGSWLKFEPHFDFKVEPVARTAILRRAQVVPALATALKTEAPDFLESDEHIFSVSYGGSSGLKVGDYILEINGRAPGLNEELLNVSLFSSTQKYIPVKILRGDKVVNTRIRLLNMKAHQRRALRSFVYLDGLLLQDLLPNDARPASEPTGGVIVREIHHLSFALTPYSHLRITPGSIITSIRTKHSSDWQKIRNLSHLKTILSSLSKGDSVELSSYIPDLEKWLKGRVHLVDHPRIASFPLFSLAADSNTPANFPGVRLSAEQYREAWPLRDPFHEARDPIRHIGKIRPGVGGVGKASETTLTAVGHDAVGCAHGLLVLQRSQGFQAGDGI